MTTLARILTVAIAAAGLAGAGAARAATQNATVSATIVKPLTLVRVQDLDLGTITLGNGVWASSTIALSQAGVRTCGANVTCSGAAQVAKYKVTGSNKSVVTISAPNVTLVNQSDATKTLTMVPNAPATVTLTSSGEPGITFPVGGSISVSSSTTGGDYVGTFNVTVDYQ